MLSIQLMRQIAELFIVMMLGFLAVQCKIIKGESVQHFSKVVVNTVIPCAIFESFQIEYTSERLSGLLLAFGAALVVHVIFFALTWAIREPLRLTAVEEASLICSNSGQLLFPLITATLGAEWIFYASAFMAIGTVVVWSMGISKISNAAQFQLKKLLCNMNILAIFVGVIVFLAGWDLPNIVDSAITNVGSMIGPACMLSIGMTIGSMKSFQRSQLWRVLMLSGWRLLIYPFACMILFSSGWVLGLHPDTAKILLITTLAAAAPSSAVIAQLAQIYDNEALWGSIINVVTTLLCILTMPFITWLYQAMTHLQV